MTIRLPYTMYIDAKSIRCWKYSPEDSQIHFPPGSTFQPNRQAVSTGLSFINTLCTRTEKNLPILMETTKTTKLRSLEEELDSLLLMYWIETNLNTRFEAPMNLRMPSLQLTNAIMIIFYSILQSLLSLAMNFYRLCMEMKIQLFSNPIQLGIASQLMLK